jgi:hypothetical protein
MTSIRLAAAGGDRPCPVTDAEHPVAGTKRMFRTIGGSRVDAGRQVPE